MISSPISVFEMSLPRIIYPELQVVSVGRKTDRDPLVLVRRELDRGLALADVATTNRSPLYGQAESTYTMVKALVPGIASLTEVNGGNWKRS
jgi:hypothetical protein